MFTKRLAPFLLALSMGVGLAACGSEGAGQGAAGLVPAANPSEGPLTKAEADTLVFMREEEKLARDVYLALGPLDSMFANIAASEQKHMDALKLLLDRYAVADPALAQGVFANPELQKLYDQLVADGRRSQLDAYRVGALIEELDIADLERLTALLTHSDVAGTYAQLTRGSRNHLRAFDGRITSAGARYTPVHLDQAAYDAIVTSARETGQP